MEPSFSTNFTHSFKVSLLASFLGKNCGIKDQSHREMTASDLSPSVLNVYRLLIFRDHFKS